MKLDYHQGTPGTYAGFDRFGRVKDQRWYDYGASADAVRIKHGYDLAGNRLWREDVVAAAASQNLDELYTYDNLHRLQSLWRGDVTTGANPSIDSENFGEQWSLDALGNWSGYDQDDAAPFGENNWTLEQTRTHNTVNEITGVTGGSWATPAHDDAGNMTNIPMPNANDADFAYTATYDAWNRLVQLKDGETTVATYEYDGLNQRKRAPQP